MIELTVPSLRDELRARIVGAAAVLLRERGASAVTTRGVAEAADVQAPTIYRLFGDKDGLIDAVAEHVMAIHVGAKAVAPTGVNPIDDLRSSWRRHVNFGLTNPQLYELLTGPGRDRRSPAIEAGIEVLRAKVHGLAMAGVLRVSEQRALDMIHGGGTGAIQALLETPPQDRDPGFADAMLEAVLASIIDPESTTRPARGAPAVAVAFAAHIPQLPALSAAERTMLTEWVARSIAASQNPQSGADPV